MRNSWVVTISLPPKMATKVRQIAKQKQMNRSELIRMALRGYLEELDALEAVRIARREESAGKLKELKGSLSDLVR